MNVGQDSEARDELDAEAEYHHWQRANEAPTVYSDPVDWRALTDDLATALYRRHTGSDYRPADAVDVDGQHPETLAALARYRKARGL